MFSKRLIAVIAAAALASVLAGMSLAFIIPGSESANNFGVIETFASNATTAATTGDSLTIMTVSPDGTLLGNATYLIRPSPVDESGSYSIADNSANDSDQAFGIISIAGANDGNYTIIQMAAPSGFARDSAPKVVQIAEGQQATATFTNSQASSIQGIRSITYTVKFHCGSISGSEGPLRPGHYDTDISILNNEQEQVKILWNAIINDGKTTNAILRTLEPERSSSIVCKDLNELFDIDSGLQKFVSGFVIIRVQLQGTLGSLAPSDAATVNQLASGSTNPLEVQVFYTANALANLPAPVLVDKIIFSIQNDTSGKVPALLLKKTLDITLESGMNEISDPELKVKDAIAAQYGLSDQERNNLQIRIRSVSVGIGAMMDDHAISLTRVAPQVSG